MSTGLEERLGQWMEDATAEIRLPPGLARRAARHRQRRIMAQTGAVTATAAAVTAAVVVSGATGAPRDTGTTATARLASKVESAMATVVAADDIMHMVQLANGHEDSWYYYGPRSTLRRIEFYSASGQPSSEVAQESSSTRYTFVSVSYPARTWFTQTRTLHGPLPVAAPPTSCGQQIYVAPGEEPALLVASIREALSCGQITKDGAAYVDGVKVTKLVFVRRSPKLVMTTTVWVEPATYLPVQFEISWTVGGHTFGNAIESIAWLPPTSANLALLQVSIPAGFTQVPPPKQ